MTFITNLAINIDSSGPFYENNTKRKKEVLGMLVYRRSVGGVDITVVAANLIACAKVKRRLVAMNFFGIWLAADWRSKPGEIVDQYLSVARQRTDQYQQYVADHRKEEALLFNDLLQAAREHTSTTNPEAWSLMLELVEEDDYLSLIMNFADVWGRLMEPKIAGGSSVFACADETSEFLGKDGLHEATWDVVNSILSGFWIHGAKLRAWYWIQQRPGLI